MKKNNIFSIIAATTILLSSCDYNDRNFDIEKGGVTETEIFTLKTTLTADDYKAIGTDKTNIALAKENGDSALLAGLSAKQYFTDSFKAAHYVPALLATTYFSADNGSAIKVKYNKGIDAPAYINSIGEGSIYTLSNDDYQTAWGANTKNNYFTPAINAENNLPKILEHAIEDAAEGMVAHISYKESSTEPVVATITELKEGFDNVVVDEPVELKDWINVTTQGTYSWIGKSYNNDAYMQQSAYKHVGELTSYMIMPKFKATDSSTLTFDYKWGHFTLAGGRVSVLVSSDLIPGYDSTSHTDAINAATWTDITSQFDFKLPTEDQSGYADKLINVGTADLSAFNGQEVYVALRYNGNGDEVKTTTFQIDNVKVSNIDITVDNTKTSMSTELYQYSAGEWAVYAYENNNMSLLKDADYSAMGLSNTNFSKTASPDLYIPQYLSAKYPYVQENFVAAVTYMYYNGSTTIMLADEFAYKEGMWVKNNNIIEQEDQFVRNNGTWVYDPSIIVTLPAEKGNATSSIYYQTMVDWVWENIDTKELGVANKGEGYVTSYGNNDYYTGASAYYNNVDWRTAKAREQYPAGFEGMSDDEVLKQIQNRFVVVLGNVLPTLNPELKYIDGVDVKFTLIFTIFNNDMQNEIFTVVYRPQADGTFLYEENSLKVVE